MHISSSSQSGIATLKDVLAYGRLTSSPPLPPGALLTTPIPYPYTYWGGLRVKPVGGGGGEREQSSSISRFLGNSGALSVLKQIVHILSSLERLFYSVIYNSVVLSKIRFTKKVASGCALLEHIFKELKQLFFLSYFFLL